MCFGLTCKYEIKRGPYSGGCMLTLSRPFPPDAACILGDSADKNDKIPRALKALRALRAFITKSKTT